jgi:CO/xanthine dehydrogenase Mo-binding subunit
MVGFQVLGKSHPRVDGREKVTGRATYAADVYLTGMLMCKLLTSKRSHARIVRIDTSRAEQLPGVRSIITGKDFPDIHFGSGALKDRRIMARDEVFYIGEPVAAVAADDELTAQEAVELIEVEYQDLEMGQRILRGKALLQEVAGTVIAVDEEGLAASIRILPNDTPARGGDRASPGPGLCQGVNP